MVKSLYYTAISASLALLSSSGCQAFTASPHTSSSRHINHHQLYNNIGSGGPSLEFLEKMGVKEPNDVARVRLSIISVEEALQMYKDAKTAEERERLLGPLREKMMEAAMGTDSNNGASNGSSSAVVTPPVAAAAAPSVVADAPKIEVKEVAVPPPPPPTVSAPIVVQKEEPKTDNNNNPAAPIPDDIASLDDVTLQLSTAAMRLDAQTVSTLLQSNPGIHLDEDTTNAAFRAVVNAVDRAEARDQPIPPTVPQMLHHIFDADLQHLLTREKITKNVTCMMPQTEGLTTHGLNYVFDDGEHKNLPLEEGRKCEDGNCCDKCSRNIFPTFAQEDEINFDTYPGLNTLTFNELEKVSAATIIQFMRLIERVRRTMAHEYGLDLKTLLPLQAYSRKYVAGTTQKGGGGGEGDFVTLHTDEATHGGYHYSCVIYLSTQGEDFQGGDFVFNDPKDPDAPAEDFRHMSLEEQLRRTGRKLTPFHPTRGAAVIFSSGWENMHEVEKITHGIRYAVPAFFTTCPVPEAAYDQMVAGKPKTDEDIADDWLHLLLAHRPESPMEGAGRVRELLMKWHYMCTPLSMH
eukprot:CAMPEP_0113408576 /NCGR_PEP_ID=MMETSP0013_2-20120614/20684_1 /TAXON_ID=2843 ORGANISM="Skeletonema costatum, Strain 1716" /NCGR_SAMPLE_ID=MMETSP0013_2 /ASSEMBLY_ACC=CAM_ASM_000158 /LENGTH=575 /DNA_ID=CAMNT_0000294629 /DNA_START=9 /DNA_END=1736 /DNA_ORIENTATION=- /assembly_acc=CAM_ASM_000158